MKKVTKNSGISLVETLIAAAIIVFAVVAVIQVYVSVIFLSDTNKEDTVAIENLTAMIEAIKCAPFSSITVDFSNGIVDGPAGNSYSALVGGYVLTNEHIVVSFVNPASDPLEITVSVSWQDKRRMNRTKYLVTKRTR